MNADWASTCLTANLINKYCQKNLHYMYMTDGTNLLQPCFYKYYPVFSLKVNTFDSSEYQLFLASKSTKIVQLQVWEMSYKLKRNGICVRLFCNIVLYVRDGGEIIYWFQVMTWILNICSLHFDTDIFFIRKKSLFKRFIISVKLFF